MWEKHSQKMASSLVNRHLLGGTHALVAAATQPLVTLPKGLWPAELLQSCSTAKKEQSISAHGI
jgi:hypothetical protein